VKVNLNNERDIWAAALLIVRRYGDDAVLAAVSCGKRLLEEDDLQGAMTWHRILSAIERLQATAPAEGENVH
jgi:hypothetical protein